MMRSDHLKELQEPADDATPRNRLPQLFEQLRFIVDEIEKETKPGSSLRALSPKIAPLRGKSPPLTPRRQATEDLRNNKGGRDQTAEDEYERVDLYPHPSQQQSDLLDSMPPVADIIDTLRKSEFEGVFNLSLLSLLFALSYNVVRSVMEHGSRVSLKPLMCASFALDLHIGGYFCLSTLSFSLSFFLLIKLLCLKKLSVRNILRLYFVCQILLLCVPAVFIIRSSISPMISLVLSSSVLVVTLKGHSYVFTNLHLFRQAAAKKNKKKTETEKEKENSEGVAGGLEAVAIKGRKEFPSNINLPNFLRFMVLLPTLAYEPKYASAKNIRFNYILKKIFIGGCLCVLMYADFMQFLLPVLQKPSLPWYYAAMKLAIPSFSLWLMGFYLLFNCVLNIFAEISFYGDRKFYSDWWNTTSIDSFWRKWNVPVHEWALRHAYVDTMHYLGLNNTQAQIATFFVSAVFHEYVFFISVNGVSRVPWFFFGMLAQIPLSIFSRKFSGKRRGNLIMWFSLFLGQPFLELLYFRKWYAEYGDIFCVRPE